MLPSMLGKLPLVRARPMLVRIVWKRRNSITWAASSSLSGLPYRMEPDFFTNSQFNSKHSAPGNWNVGEFASAEFDDIGNRQLEIYDPAARRPLIFKLQRILLDEMPEGEIFILPVKIDDCTPLDEKLSDINWVELFPSYDDGMNKLMRVFGT